MSLVDQVVNTPDQAVTGAVTKAGYGTGVDHTYGAPRGGRGNQTTSGRGGRGRGPAREGIPPSKVQGSVIYDDAQLDAVMPRYNRRITEMKDLGLLRDLPAVEESTTYGELASTLNHAFSQETATSLLSKENKWKIFLRKYGGLKAVVDYENTDHPVKQDVRSPSIGSQITKSVVDSSVTPTDSSSSKEQKTTVPSKTVSDANPKTVLEEQEETVQDCAPLAS